MQLQLSLAVADKLCETLLVRGEPLDTVDAIRVLLASPNAPPVLCRQVLAMLVEHDQRFCYAGAWDASDRRAVGDSAPGQPVHDPLGRISLRQWEAPDPDLTDVPFVALDLETTGAQAGAGKITEIGAVRIEGFREVRRFSTLVNPMRPIPAMITQITGITQQMVAGAPRIEEVIPELLEFLRGAVIVAHNAAFDVGFLNYELRRLKGRRLGEGAIDTLPLARALAPGLPNYRLGTVAQALGAPVVACHRALADAQAAGHVFITLMGRLQERGVTRLSEVRSYVTSSRSSIDKLHLTRDIPRSPGTYCFVDKDGCILYVGKADQLHERVRSHFVSRHDQGRKMRQAVRLVERVDWDETCTPLEALVRQQQLILEHRPPCNIYGSRPDNYTYIKVGATAHGLSLCISNQPPKWLDARESDEPSREISKNAHRRETDTPSPRRPLVLGPFRGRSRLSAALDLLQRCYPIARCPGRHSERPCARARDNNCLAPCAGDPVATSEHNALVMQIIGWLAGDDSTGLPHPLERSDELIQSLSQQRRCEEAQNLREARDHLLSVRHSYRSLVEACSLCFAALWPLTGNNGGSLVQMNLVWNGRLTQTVSLRSSTLDADIDAALGHLRDLDIPASIPPINRPHIAVSRRELDSLLAIRRWYIEAQAPAKIPLPNSTPDSDVWTILRTRLVEEARGILAPR